MPRSRSTHRSKLSLPACSKLLLAAFSLVAANHSAVAQETQLASALQSTAKPAVHYRVSFPEAQAHYAAVELNLTASPHQPLELFLPVWTPGSYLVREYARHLDSVEARDAEGKPLPISKSSKNTWTIAEPPDGQVRIMYRVYCNELSVRTNFVDAEFGVLNGAATCLTTEPLRGQPHLIEFDLPQHWQQAVASLKRPPVGGPPHSFLAANYDELVDSPIVLGNPSLHPFEVAGVNHFLVNLGGDGLWNGDRAAADVAKIVREHQAMWGSAPYDRYYFLNVIAENGGGLEHDHSCLLMTDRWSFRNPSNYKRWLGLVSHEFFHAWNVRRLRPVGLRQYDYLNETYFDELWVAEGVTSYYDALALARAQLTSETEYLAALSKEITMLQTTPGRLRQSLAESSHDTWIKFYRPNENSNNTTISYYNKGALVAFLLDLEIRRRTENAASLDDVMRRLFDGYRESGYTNRDVLKVASEVAGSDLSEWFATHIDSTEELDYGPALDWLGLEFSGRPKRPESPTPAAAEPDGGAGTAGQGPPKQEETASPPPPGNAWLGVSTSSDGGKLIVNRVTEDSPGFRAGLNVDDELIAIDGFRLDGRLSDVLAQYAAGDRIEMLYARRGKVRRLEIELSASPDSTWRLVKQKDPTELQIQSLQKWLASSVSATEN